VSRRAFRPDPQTIILVPGAWTGGWVWEPTAAVLRSQGHQVLTPTLPGLTAGEDHTGISLQTHVDTITELVSRADRGPVVLVGHSYSGLIVGQVADRLSERVAHTVFVEAFLPHNGRSLLDDFGDSDADRLMERENIERHLAWLPPPEDAVATEPDLSAGQRRWLCAGFVAHPARTVLEPARLLRPLDSLPATVVVCRRHHQRPRPESAPPDRTDQGWPVRTLVAGHWPMISRPDALAEYIATAGASADTQPPGARPSMTTPRRR